MPIYGYECKSCDHTFDALQKMSDPVLVDCPECGEAALKKQLSAPKFRLKGAGWYETDFKPGDTRNIAGEAEGGKDDKPADGASKDGDKKADRKADTKSDSKPEKKADKPAAKSKTESKAGST